MFAGSSAFRSYGPQDFDRVVSVDSSFSPGPGPIMQTANLSTRSRENSRAEMADLDLDTAVNDLMGIPEHASTHKDGKNDRI